MYRGKLWKLIVTATAAVTLIMLGLAPAAASSANLSHPYNTTASSIPNGSLVSLSTGRTDYVEPANVDNGARLLGVAVAINDSLLAVDAGQGKVQVATSGNASVLVSDLNGAINVGDQVAVSPFNGIGMKAIAGSHIIGLAQTAFNANSPGVTTKQVKDRQGHVSSIRVGYVQASIAIGTNSEGVNLSSLQRLAKNVTGHAVSNFRVLMSLLVLLVALVALVTLIYASIYGGILAVGRNPLARRAVFRSLGTVLLMAGATALVSGGVIFLLLR